MDRPFWDFSLGVFLKREFGDQDGLSQAWPLFRFRLKTEHARFIFGFLDSSNNHGLPEELVSLQYPFIHPVEEGLQVLAHYGPLKADAWINWYLMNTPDYREFFAAGCRLSGTWQHVSGELAVRMMHHGGQLYESGPLTNNLTAVARVSVFDYWDLLRAKFGVSGSFYGSSVNEMMVYMQLTPTTNGMGGGVECYFAPYGWKLYAEAFFGDNFYSEQGNPLYRTNKPLYRFGLRKSFNYHDILRARFQAEGIMIESNFEYDYLLVIDVFLDFFLHRFGSKPS